MILGLSKGCRGAPFIILSLFLFELSFHPSELILKIWLYSPDQDFYYNEHFLNN